MATHISFIVNQSAGSHDDSVETVISEYMDQASQYYSLHTTSSIDEVASLTDELKDQSDIIAIFGGDGTVTTAARILCNSKTGLFILPGGTANVLAKEIGMPNALPEALTILTSGNYELKAIDMGSVNGHPFVLRINLGILADMITETSEEDKQRWGQWAYGITAFQQRNTTPLELDVQINDTHLKLESVGLTITNSGNVGMKGMSFLPGISVADGYLDLISLDEGGLLKLLQVTGAILLQKDSDILRHEKVYEAVLTPPTPIQFLCDDEPMTAAQLTVKVLPAALRVAVPKNTTDETD